MQIFIFFPDPKEATGRKCRYHCAIGEDNGEARFEPQSHIQACKAVDRPTFKPFPRIAHDARAHLSDTERVHVKKTRA